MNGQEPMPLYKCHKEVRAAKIKNMVKDTTDDEEWDGTWILTFEDVDTTRTVDNDWVLNHRPETGGYFVHYIDGYESYSPAKAFEEGYTRIND